MSILIFISIGAKNDKNLFRYILSKYLFIYSEFLNRRKIEKRVRVSEPCGDGDLPPMVGGGGKHRTLATGKQIKYFLLCSDQYFSDLFLIIMI